MDDTFLNELGITKSRDETYLYIFIHIIHISAIHASTPPNFLNFCLLSTVTQELSLSAPWH